MRLAKLQLFARVVRKAPAVLLDVIHAQASLKKGWVWSLRQDLSWLKACTAEFSECLAESLGSWVELVKADPKSFLKRVGKVCKSPFANIVTQWATTPVLEAFARPIRCMLCNTISRSYQAHCSPV